MPVKDTNLNVRAERVSLVAEYNVLLKLEDDNGNLYGSDVWLMTAGINYRFQKNGVREL